MNPGRECATLTGMKFFIASPWKNRESVQTISNELKKRGHEVYSYLESGANLLTGEPIEKEMNIFSEALGNWRKDNRIEQIFESEMKGLRESEVLVLLEPAGGSSLLEAGVAYGLGKKLILVGGITKPEVVYLVFDEIYLDMSSFLHDLDSGFKLKAFDVKGL